ncbi:iron chelate uptake ABC transporter family permease subunit [Gordonia alkaliphila]|uniref:iron chelate uptake ABC transporter family permease subunit n=1 Tax=Gordonia alkaliphila TaxID=1053547 RepID=UPI001FF6AEE5|nr:iron chelate uptake ABC transporter family permease subunit [Gordonia alkaliphila]MCK0441028.1 iron chelate uptake ABC transporter family permease subunit [Gordonia alkaliphila]
MSPSDLATAAPSITGGRSTRVSPTARLVIAGLLAAAALAAFLLLRNGIDGLEVESVFGLSFTRRVNTAIAIVIAAVCQGMATVLFQTVTHNRILTPAIIGFDSLYVLIQTVAVSVVGASFIANSDTVPQFLMQTAAMVVFALALYGWLFAGRRFGSLFLLLLTGVVLGLAFRSIAEFLQRLLSPTDFDALFLNMYGRISDVNASLLPVAGGLVAVVAVVVWRRRRIYDVLLLGREPAIGLGLDHRRELTLTLVMIAVLMAVSTALVGPLTFFGFIIATLAYQVAGDWRHRALLPMSILIGIFTLAAGQLLINTDVFGTNVMLTVVIEFCGGVVFLGVLLLRKGSL